MIFKLSKLRYLAMPCNLPHFFPFPSNVTRHQKDKEKQDALHGCFSASSFLKMRLRKNGFYSKNFASSQLQKKRKN